MRMEILTRVLLDLSLWTVSPVSGYAMGILMYRHVGEEERMA